jgi:hypothetical protein
LGTIVVFRRKVEFVKNEHKLALFRASSYRREV